MIPYIPQSLIIVGRGGFAKEAAEWAEDAGYNIMGFFDRTCELPNEEFRGVPVYNEANPPLGTDIEYDGMIFKTQFLVAIGDNAVRAKEYKRMEEDYGLIPVGAIIHPKATVAQSASIGDGTIICPGVVVCPDVSIGSNCIVNLNATIGHDSIIGHNVNIAPGANLSGFSDVRDNVYIGTNSALREKLTIGAYATVGMGATVVKPVENATTVIGSAAKLLEKK